MRTRQQEIAMVAADFERPSDGPVWKPEGKWRELPATGNPGWQSNGGSTRGHPSRSLPFSLEIKLPEQQGQLVRIHLVGVFAEYADTQCEALGTLGATVQLLTGDREIAARYDLVNGRHYGEAKSLRTFARVVGDGTSVESIDVCELHGDTFRVDLLTLDVPVGIRPRRLHFKDLGSPASFIVFDVFFEFCGVPCGQGKAREGGLSLGELGAAVRVGDRLKFGRALEQLENDLDEVDQLDEARALALTFLGIVSCALLETAGGRKSDTLLLHTARELDILKTRTHIKEAIRDRILEVTEGFFAPSDSPSDRLVDRALAIVERHFAKDLTDAMVAAQLGLSTSHFRFLFRQATGHPFHKYVVALRLEKARQMLIEQEMPVSQVATAVGFTGLSHFSRAFTQRFSASPSHIRRAAG